MWQIQISISQSLFTSLFFVPWVAIRPDGVQTRDSWIREPERHTVVSGPIWTDFVIFGGDSFVFSNWLFWLMGTPRAQKKPFKLHVIQLWTLRCAQKKTKNCLSGGKSYHPLLATAFGRSVLFFGWSYNKSENCFECLSGSTCLWAL